MKNKFNSKGAYGFSKYTQDGLVTYSETKEKSGNLIKHYYEYDDSGRRTHYIQTDIDGRFIMNEYTYYYPNGYKRIYVSFYKEKTYCERLIDRCGREVYIKSVDATTHLGKVKELDTYRNKYKEYDINDNTGLFVFKG